MLCQFYSVVWNVNHLKKKFFKRNRLFYHLSSPTLITSTLLMILYKKSHCFNTV